MTETTAKLIPTRCPGCGSIARMNPKIHVITCDECKKSFGTVIRPVCDDCGDVLKMRLNTYRCSSCRKVYPGKHDDKVEDFILKVEFATMVIDVFREIATLKGMMHLKDIDGVNVSIIELLDATVEKDKEGKFGKFTPNWIILFYALESCKDLLTFHHVPARRGEVEHVKPEDVKVLILPKPNARIEKVLKKRLSWVEMEQVTNNEMDRETITERHKMMKKVMATVMTDPPYKQPNKRIYDNARRARVDGLVKDGMVKLRPKVIVTTPLKPLENKGEELAGTFDDLLDFGDKEEFQCSRLLHIKDALERFKKKQIPNDINIIVDLMDNNKHLCEICDYKCNEESDAGEPKEDLVETLVEAGKKYRKEYYGLLKGTPGVRIQSREDLVDNLIVNFINLIASEMGLEERTSLDEIR